MRRIVVPARRILWMSSMHSAASAGFMPAKGSSSRRSLGRAPRAIPIPTSRCWPEGSSPAVRDLWAARPTMSRMASTCSSGRRLREHPMAMLSSTVSRENTRVFWKVRTRPLRASTWGRRPVTSSPRKRTLPRVGRSNPLMMLKVVVFPAPLGPTRPVALPSGTVKERARIAWNPPYSLLRPRTSSMVVPHPGCWRPLGLGGLPRPGEPSGEEGHGEDEEHAEGHLRQHGGDGAERVPQDGDERGAHKGPGEGARPSHHGHDEEVEGADEREGIGAEEGGVVG